MVERVIRLPLMDDSPTARLLYGADVREGLKLLPDASVHTVCTSPPYWGLRDYGTGSWEGGDPTCEHQVRIWDGPKQTQGAQSGHASKADRIARKTCQCGATRKDSQIGLEESPEEYVQNLVDVFREVKRVLRSDGTLWLNLGDSYSGYHGNSRVSDEDAPSNKSGYVENMRASTVGVGGLKNKDLAGIPWVVALALRADGWYLRSDIIWAKPNPMPESVTDRPTKSHEYVFLFAHPDSGGRYFYDGASIREPFVDERQGRDGGQQESERNRGGREDGFTKPNGIDPSGNGGKNKRTVWNVNPRPYPGAHFACWPPELVETMIKAGSSEHGVCSSCGAPWVRQTSNVEPGRVERPHHQYDPGRPDGMIMRGGRLVPPTKVTKGWSPTCQCIASLNGSTVLDPFSGSATTGHVALRLGRNYVGLDLNEKYLPLAEARVLGNQAPDTSTTAPDEGSALDLFGGGE